MKAFNDPEPEEEVQVEQLEQLEDNTEGYYEEGYAN